MPPIEKLPGGAVKSPKVWLKPCTVRSVVPTAGVKAPDDLFTPNTQVLGADASTE